MQPRLSQQEQRALIRAKRAVRCLPFRRRFYEELEREALSSTQLAARSDWTVLSRQRLSANHCEDLLVWLLQLAHHLVAHLGLAPVVRVRLTPLGRVVLSDWPGEIPSASLPSRLRHWIKQHWPRL